MGGIEFGQGRVAVRAYEYQCTCVRVWGCVSCVQPERVSFHLLGVDQQFAAYAGGLEE